MSDNDNYEADANGDSGGEESEFYVEPSKPRNNQLLVFVGLLAVGAGAMYFLYFKTGPATAVASQEAIQADETISTFLNGGDNSIEKMEEMRRNTEKVVERFLNYPANTQVPLKDLRSNPFRMLADTDDGSAASEAMAKARREEERQAVLKSVNALKLDLILFGSKPKCMINKAMYGEGDQVDGFSIEKITQANVIVRKDVFRFELTMQRPEKPVRF